MWCLIVEEGRGEVRVRELKNWQIIYVVKFDQKNTKNSSSKVETLKKIEMCQ